MHMGVKYLLACHCSDIRTEVKPLHIGVFPVDCSAAFQGKLVQRFPLFESGFKNVVYVALWNVESVQWPHREFISDSKS
jgi:hypothetical protein